MAYTARDLITRSFYLSGIVARDAQSVTGTQIQDGLFLLNDLLNFKAIQTDLIPYWTIKDFVAVAGQEKYPFDNVYAVETVTFNISDVRYATYKSNRSLYFGSPRVNNIDSLSFNWYFNRRDGGGDLYVYFLPISDYPYQMVCKVGLQDVTLDTDLLTAYDTAYLAYLRYALAEYICNDYNIEFNESSRAKLMEIARTLMYVSPPDTNMVKSSVLVNSPGLNWGDINIGHMWRP